MKAIHVASAAALLVGGLARHHCWGQAWAEKECLSAVLPQELMRYAGIEVPSRENIRVLSDAGGRYVEFRLVPGQAKKNNGIRNVRIEKLNDWPVVEAIKDSWLFASFRQRYEGRVEIDAEGRTRTVPLPNPMKEEQLHLALSTDGRHWEPLNGNRPVWSQWLRDPFVGRGPDGLWHLLATGRRPASRSGQTNLGPACLYATSRDLLNWENVGSLHLMQGLRDEAGRLARNIWAPEWFLDRATGELVLLWSSSFEDAGWKRSRLWFSRTCDWQTFTPAKVLFAPPYSVIDGTLLEHGGTYYLFHKEEEFGAKTGERRAIRLATSDRLEGPYQIHQGPLNQGQIAPVITEGPSVMPDPTKPGWLLLYDYCMSDGYGISTSSDLTNWSIEESVSLPPDARHGSITRLTAAEAAKLRASFPNKND